MPLSADLEKRYPTPTTKEQAIKQLAKLIQDVAHGQKPVYDVFRDFIEMGALAMTNRWLLPQSKTHKAREEQYAKLLATYPAHEQVLFPIMFREFCIAASFGIDDILGRMFSELGLYNTDKGQFFTPYSLSRAVASFAFQPEAVKAQIRANGFVTVSEPACGAGAMVLAFADQLREIGICAERHMHAQLVDIDIRAVHMAVLQCSIFGIPATVIHGNTLMVTQWDVWYTPSHIIGGYDLRLDNYYRKARRLTAEASAIEKMMALDKEATQNLPPVAPPKPVPPPKPPQTPKKDDAVSRLQSPTFTRELASLLTRARAYYYDPADNGDDRKAAGEFMELTLDDWDICHALQLTPQGPRPVMTNDLYDGLEQCLRQRDPEHPLLRAVGTKGRAGDEPLPYTIGSLDKIFPTDTSGFSRQHVLVALKYDGCAAYLEYGMADGPGVWRPTRLLSGGDGLTGKNLSWLIPILVQTRAIPAWAEKETRVRLELIVPRQEFADKWSKTYANARNMVIGLMGKKEPVSAHYSIRAVALWLYNEPDLTPYQQLQVLKERRFEVPQHRVYDHGVELTVLAALYKDRRVKAAYDIDGLVLTHNVAGHVPAMYPTWAKAFKLGADKQDHADTTVKAVEYRVGKDAYLKPRALIEPVQLCGVTINYVTCHNAGYVRDQGIGPGATVRIVRSGDVIPYITQVVTPVAPALPSCAYTWTESMVDAVADDPGMEQRVNAVAHAVRKLDIDYLGEQTIRQVLEPLAPEQQTVDTLFLWDEQQWVRRTSEVVGARAYRNVRAALQGVEPTVLADALQVFGRGLGTELLKAVEAHYPDVWRWGPDAKPHLFARAKAVHGMGDARARQFETGYPLFRRLLKKLGPVLTLRQKQAPKVVGTALINQFVSFTGFRDQQLADEVAQHSGQYINYGKRTTLLVYNPDSASLTKLRECEARGGRLMTPTEFRQLLEANDENQTP